VAGGDRICTCAGPRSDVLAFSPDGKILATADHDYDSQRRAAIRLWHTRTGKEFARLTTYGFGSGARTLVFTADGKTLLSGNDGGSVEVWDVARGTRLRQLAKHRFRVDGLALHPDGRTLACSDQNSMIRFYDLDTGRELHPTGGNHGWVRSLAFLPGGKKLVTHAADEFVRFWNIDTGKEIRKWDLMTDKIDPAAFSKDGQLLVDHKGRLWDVSSGQCRAAHQGVSDGWLSFSGNGQMAATISSRNRDVIRLWHLAHYEGVWRLRSKKNTGFWCPALSANGRTLAALDLQYQVHCFDTRSGRQLCRFPEVRSGKATGIYGLALSPDGRTAVTAGHDSPFVAWETRTGQMRAVLSNEIGLRPELAFSRDGRFLAAGEHNGTIRIWKLPAAKERRVLHQAGGVACLAFSADNQRLASGGYDTTALIWNIEDLRKGKPKQSSDLTQEQLETAWCDLAGPDAVRAYKAIGKLIAYPHQAVALFRNRLGPIDAGPQRVDRLIADLDSDKFPVRHEATKALEEIGEPAVSLLKQSAAKPPSEEMRRRIDHLLRHIAAGILHPSTLRTLRALEVLEAIGTPDAISVIEKIAAGTPTALITEDAEASLERLRDPSITGYRLSADGR
jgi:WD40 repeat protein